MSKSDSGKAVSLSKKVRREDEKKKQKPTAKSREWGHH